MRPLHLLEIENFKRFGERQRIELDHPTVLRKGELHRLVELVERGPIGPEVARKLDLVVERLTPRS